MPIAKLFRPVNTAKFVSIGASTVVGGEKGFATVLVERDNVRDHRAGTSDHLLQKHAQVRLRVHHIVMSQRNQTNSI